MTSIDYNKKPSKKSIAYRNTVYGIGINDSDYITKQYINGKWARCFFYQKWIGMLERCYSNRYQKNQPTYIGCTVCDEWHSFMVFRSWMMQQDWKGKALDKDILVPGNKIYKPETCVFVSQEINNLLTNRASKRGDLPQGVTFFKPDENYRAQITKYGKKYHIGYYDTAQKAETAYKKEKSEHVLEIAMQQTNNRLRNGLILQSELISS